MQLQYVDRYLCVSVLWLVHVQNINVYIYLFFLVSFILKKPNSYFQYSERCWWQSQFVFYGVDHMYCTTVSQWVTPTTTAERAVMNAGLNLNFTPTSCWNRREDEEREEEEEINHYDVLLFYSATGLVYRPTTDRPQLVCKWSTPTLVNFWI